MNNNIPSKAGFVVLAVLISTALCIAPVRRVTGNGDPSSGAMATTERAQIASGVNWCEGDGVREPGSGRLEDLLAAMSNQELVGNRVFGRAGWLAAAGVQSKGGGAGGVAPKSAFIFSNNTPITINDSVAPPTPASPYPSPIVVSGVTNPIARVTVTLTNISHTFPDDIDILLVGPLGQKTILMSDAGGSGDITNVTLRFDDLAGASLSDSGPIATGAFSPTDFTDVPADSFPGGPAGPFVATLSVFAGTNANGTWNLFVVDDAGSDSGTIAGGWSLTILDGDGVVTNTNDSGTGSLRQAILDANVATDPNTITFNIPGSGVRTIMPTSLLPPILQPVSIDGTTQPGFAGAPLIELNGASAGVSTPGLQIFTPNCAVKGLVINGFNGVGILLGGGPGFSTIQGNYIGTNAAGNAPSPNAGNGIDVSSSNNIIGGVTSSERNIISGNVQNGVFITGVFATSNTVQGNLIGTDATGTSPLGNSLSGVSISNAANNVIGGTTAGARNIISGNTNTGVEITGSGATGNIVRGNFIGPGITGSSALGNPFGVLISGGAASNTVGGTTAAARNIISGNNNGVAIDGANSNSVQSNFIGTDVSGTLALSNTVGLSVAASASNNTIGGAGSGNTIAYNFVFGIVLVTGAGTGNAMFSNSVFSNFVLGVDLGGDGVTVNDSLDSDTGPNNLQNFPVLISAISNAGNNTTTIIGSLDSTPGSTFTLQFFSNPSCHSSNFGEGTTYLGSNTVTTTIDGNPASFIVAFSPAVPVGQVVTATATNSSTRDTSEFSRCRTVTGDSPTIVDDPDFAAAAYDDGTLLQWSTGLEVNNLGFNVYRDESGKISLVNSQLIAGSAFLVGSDIILGSGHSYQWWDGAPAGKSTIYWLEDRDINGQSRWHGPFSPNQVGAKQQPPSVRQARTLASLSMTEAPSLPSETRARLLPGAEDSTSAGQVQSLIASSSNTVKLQVNHEAWYRVSPQDLFKAGLDPSIDPRSLQLFVDGKQQAITVTGQDDGRLDLEDTVEFYGMGIDSPFSELRTYYLAAGKQVGLRISNIQSLAHPAPGGSFEFAVERRDRAIYLGSLKNGDKENFFGAIVASQPVNQTLTINHLAPSSARATLKIALQGVTNFSHLVGVRLNGSDVGQLVFDRQNAGESTIAISPSLLREGQNQVTLIARAGPSDVSLVDYIKLAYQHTFTADDGSLRFSAGSGQPVTIDGFATDQIQIFDVTDPYAVQAVSGYLSKQESGGFSVSLVIPGKGQRSLLALTSDTAARPAKVISDYASKLRDPLQGADLLIITPRELFDSVRALKEYRQKQGLSVAVADIEDIYDEFSFGQKTPYAVKAFIEFAKTQWKKPVKYVLLFGDASMDPKNYLGLDDSDLVSTKLIDTTFMETASDDWLADSNNDGIADVALGRLPVRTAAEAEAMIGKLAAYEQGEAAEEALLASDRNEGYNFEAANAALKPLLPPGVRAVEVKRGQLGDQATKAALIDAINRGQRIANYSGHGNLNAWRGNVFTSTDALQLQNGRHLSIFVMMNCLNGYFQDPATDSLAESLLKAPGGGAVAVWASSSMTFPNGQTAINEEFYRQVFGSRARLGDAAMRAKLATFDSDVRRTWILLGDPTMKLK